MFFSDCLNAAVDFALVIDASGSIRDSKPASGSQTNWEIMMGFLQQLIDVLNVTPVTVKIGMVLFSTTGIYLPRDLIVL